MTSSKIKIMTALPDLNGSGAEKIIIEILNNLDHSRYECSLVLFARQGQFLDIVPEDVKVYAIGESRHYRLLGLIKIVYKYIQLFKKESPDIVFGGMNVCNFPLALAAKLAGVRCIVHEVSHSRLDLEQEFSFPLLSKMLLKFTYPMADVQLALSEGIRQSLINDMGMDGRKIVVSYAPVDTEAIHSLMQKPLEVSADGQPWPDDDIPVVVGIGSLIMRKGFDCLIRAVAEVNKVMPLRLALVGQGPEKETFRAMAENLGIEDKVYFAGFQSNPYKYLARSAIFTLASVHEGLAIVVVEALIAGVPVVSTDCPVGPSEILEGGRYGLLVPVGDYMAMSKVFIKLLNDGDLRSRLSDEGKVRAEAFDKKVVIDKLQRLIEKTVAGRSLEA